MATIVPRSLTWREAPSKPPLPRQTPRTQAPAPPEPLWRHFVGRQLRTIRRERGETLGRVAERAGVSPQYLSEIERGRKEPSSEVLAAVTGALEITLLDLTLAVAGDLSVHVPAARPAGSRGQAFALAA